MTTALEFLGALVLEDGRRWAEASTPVQVADARAVLDESSRIRRHWVSRARGYAKTQDGAGDELAILATQAPAGSNSYTCAADVDQGALLLQSAAGFIARTGLQAMFDVQSRRITHRESGASLIVLAADASSAYGLRPYVTFVDELCNWPDTPNARGFFDAVSTAWLKYADARAVIITTSGSPSHFSHKIYESAVAEPDLWRVSETHGPAPWTDKRLLEAERRRLLESTYQRLWENQWTAADDALVRPDDLRACVVLSGPLAYDPRRAPYVVAADLGTVNDRTVAVVAHREQDWATGFAEPAIGDFAVGTRVVLDRIQVWSGTRAQPVQLGAVEAWLAQASETYEAKIVVDPWQAIGMAQRLRARGRWVEEFPFTSQSVGRIGSTLHTLLRSHALALPDDADLLDELASVRLEERVPGSVRLTHSSGKHDDRAVALGLACVQLIDAPSIVFPRDLPRLHPRNGTGSIHDTDVLDINVMAQEW